MTDDYRAAHEDRRQFSVDILEAFDRVRDELRDEIQRSEGRVMTAVADVRTAQGDLREDLETAERAHAGVHIHELEARSIVHARFEDFMRRAELAQARKDGALGVVRLAFDLIGRNWRGIAAIGGVLAVVLGNVHISLVAQ